MLPHLESTPPLQKLEKALFRRACAELELGELKAAAKDAVEAIRTSTKCLGIKNDNSNPGFVGLRGSRRKFRKIFEKFSKKFCTNRSFVRLLVRSKIFQILVRADAIDLVQKSSNFEPSSRFFGRLKILNSKRRRNEAFEFDSSCRAPQRALQLESNSNATV